MNKLYSDSKKNNLDVYDEFLLNEYENIASAHFNTVNSISTFFRYYLLIITIPIPLLAITLRPSDKYDIFQYIDSIMPYLGMAAFIVACVGLFVMCFIANLRFDAVLYARTINGIRRYFANKSGLSFEEEHRYRSLPISKYLPLYTEYTFFFWVILAFAFLNSAYTGAGFYAYFRNPNVPTDQYLVKVAFCIFLVSIGIHILCYIWLARSRETGYLKKLVLGVDIDGVLNFHRDHFCKTLKQVCGKDLDPEKINKIPVRDIEGEDITEDDELAVFNTIAYWTEMPPDTSAIEVLGKLEKIFRYKIKLFTHRPYPIKTKFPKDRFKEYEKQWKDVSKHWWLNFRNLNNIIWPLRLKNIQDIPIRIITLNWLIKHGFPYKNLIIESGNEHSSEIVSKAKNRFVISQLDEIKIFVEDDLDKAKKLTSICELVFLIDHPYNRVLDGELPYNLIPVKSWDEIYDYFRKSL